MSHHVLREAGLLIIAAGLLLLAIWIALPRRGTHKRPHGERAERLATDTDVRAALPLTPLPAPTPVYKHPAQVPRIVPDVQRQTEQCWCGQGPRWHPPQYVTDALRGITTGART